MSLNKENGYYSVFHPNGERMIFRKNIERKGTNTMKIKKCIICGSDKDKLPSSYVCKACREVLLAKRNAYIKERLLKTKRC